MTIILDFFSVCLPSYNFIILTFLPSLNAGFSETVYDINIYSVWNQVIYLNILDNTVSTFINFSQY